MNAKKYYLRAGAFSVILFVVIALVVAFVGRIDVHFDLTEAGLHTVSEQTRTILSKLTDAIVRGKKKHALKKGGIMAKTGGAPADQQPVEVGAEAAAGGGDATPANDTTA